MHGLCTQLMFSSSGPKYRRDFGNSRIVTDINRKSGSCISNSTREGGLVTCGKKRNKSCEPWHHSGIWQFPESDGRLRSPASLESLTPLRRRLAPCVCVSEAGLPGLALPSTTRASKLQDLDLSIRSASVRSNFVEMRTSCQPRDAYLTLRGDPQLRRRPRHGEYAAKSRRLIGTRRASCCSVRRKERARGTDIHRKRTTC